MTKPEVSSFTVVRKHWYRGQGSPGSRLKRRNDGQMCCLGFYAQACGISSEGIEGVGFPSSIPSGSENVDSLKWLWEREGREEDEEDPESVIGRINDNRDISAVNREILLTKEFLDHGVTVRFVDGE